jgi:hypothetical protein
MLKPSATPPTPSVEQPTVPFFARKVGRVSLTVRAGIRAGLREQDTK